MAKSEYHPRLLRGRRGRIEYTKEPNEPSDQIRPGEHPGTLLWGNAACSVLQLSWPYLDVQQVYSLPEESDLALYSCDHSQNFDWLIVGQGDGSTAQLDPRGIRDDMATSPWYRYSLLSLSPRIQSFFPTCPWYSLLSLSLGILTFPLRIQTLQSYVILYQVEKLVHVFTDRLLS